MQSSYNTPINHCEGSGALLVLIDSRGAYWNRMIVAESILSALNHFGIPYRIHDLAHARIEPQSLDECAALIIAQNRIGRSLNDEDVASVKNALERGLGLVNFDSDIQDYPASYFEIFGFERINPHPFTTDHLQVRDNTHPISQLQDENETHRLDRFVSATMIEKWGRQTRVLLDGILGKDQLIHCRHHTPNCAFVPGNYPLVFATDWGKGKAVQFNINPRLWMRDFYGHARGLDDVFSRAILWAARKPFAILSTPPFVTMSIDDCAGVHDFKYVDIAVEHGFHPMASLFLDEVDAMHDSKIKSEMNHGRATYNTHGFSYYDLLTYDFGRGELSSSELEKNFAREDAYWNRVGTRPGKTLRFHWGEYGTNALPRLKQRGHRYFCPALQMGTRKVDMMLDRGYLPYGLNNFYYDTLPDDPDLFAFMCAPKRHQEDFLTGCTPFGGESHVDVDKAAESARKNIRLGLRNGHYGELITHEQKINTLKLDDWDRILSHGLSKTGDLPIKFASHDEIGDYLQAKFNSRITRMHVDNGRLQYSLEGNSEVSLQLQVVHDSENLHGEELEIPNYSGRLSVE